MTDAEGVFVPYREFGSISRPVLTVEFSFGSETLDFPMLIGSGADNIVLPQSTMEWWSLREEDCAVVAAGTVYGSQTGCVGPTIRISFPDLWPDHAFEAPVIFTPWLNSRSYGLLGREPRFDYVSVIFGHQLGYGFQLRFDG